MNYEHLLQAGIRDPKAFVLSCIASGIGGLHYPDKPPVNCDSLRFHKWRHAKPNVDDGPHPGEVSAKYWATSEAERCSRTIGAIMSRLRRGKYPDLKLRRVNSRVIYITP